MAGYDKARFPANYLTGGQNNKYDRDTSPVKLVHYATSVDNPVLIILTIKIFYLYLLFEIYYQQILLDKQI